VLVNIDEVATGALVNAIAVAGRRLSLALASVPRRRREHLRLDRRSLGWERPSGVERRQQTSDCLVRRD
jgi:hypothetical protein